MNLTQFDAGDTFKLISTVAEAISGETLNIGSPNCRVRVSRPLHEFMNAWCQQGPSHHIALGLADKSQELVALLKEWDSVAFVFERCNVPTECLETNGCP